MIRQISSLELHFLLQEIQILKNSRINKIYQPENDVLIFILYKRNIGIKILRVMIGKALFLDEGKENYETLGFGMFLRKHLNGYFLYDIAQLEPERILKLSFKIKDDKKFLYLEFFGKGNAILCCENNIIINSLGHHEFKGRTISPKVDYKYPIMKYNLFYLNKEDLIDLFNNSKKDSIVTCLAVELGLGGVYSEEMCLLSNISKNKKPNVIESNEIDLISHNIKKIINKKIEPRVILKYDKPEDVTPFGLEFYKKYEKKEFSTLSEALSFFYSHFKEAKETEFDKRLRNLNRIIEEQKEAIEELKKEEQELREKGEFIYHKYILIKEILEEVNKASKKYSWKEIKEKLNGHNIIKEVNEKERKVVVEIE